MNDHLKRVAAHHNHWSETYDSDYFGRFDLYHKITWDNIQRFLPLEKDAAILDAGGGTGIFSVELANIGYHVILTDISQGMLEKAREKVARLGLENRVEVREADICDMPQFEDKRFAMVLCEGDPLSYCGEHKAAIRELARVVRPGGAVIASVDNRAGALNWLRDSDDREAVERLLATGQVLIPEERPEFRYMSHAFTAEELRSLFESNGLAVERIIGKPVIAHRLRRFDGDDPEVREWLFRLELEYNDDPAFYPWAGHLEIAGRKT